MFIGPRHHLRHLKILGLLVLMSAGASAWSQDASPPPGSNPPAAAQDGANSESQSNNGSQTPPQDPHSRPPEPEALPDIEGHPESRLEVFGGYSFIDLHANVNDFKYSEIDGGPITSGALWFNKHLGIQAEGAIHEQTPTSCYSTAQAGPIYRFFTAAHLSPYFHVDAGTTRIGIKGHQGCAFNLGATVGAGLDYIIPNTSNRLAFRILQADYDYARLKYTVTNGTVTTSGSTNVDVPRLSSGFVLRLGDFERAPAKSIQCHTDPTIAVAGDKLVLAAYVRGYVFGQKYGIRWSSTAGKVIYPGPDVLVDTTGVAPGIYSATAVVTRGKNSRSLLECHASFEVKAPPMPAVRCSANPTTVNQLDEVTITADANTNPPRQLYYSFSTTSGQIRRNGNVAILQTATARPGVITITCRVQDELGQVAETNTQVTVLEAAPAPVTPPAPIIGPETPPTPAPAPVVSAPPAPIAAPSEPAPSISAKKADKMCSLSFDRDLAHPATIDSASRACLDQVAIRLRDVPGTRVTLIGNHAANEEDGPQRAAERTFNAKSYLVEDKSVDAARIDVRTGSSTNRSVEIYFLAPGMHYDPPPTEQNRVN